MASLSETIVAAYVDRIQVDRDRPAVFTKKDGSFQPRTWGELAHDVEHLAVCLKALGVHPGDRVVQWCDNRYEWIVTDLAIQLVRAVHVPVHAPLSAQQAIFQTVHSEARLAIVGGADETSKLTDPRLTIPDNVRFVSHDEVPDKVGGRLVEPVSALIKAALSNLGESTTQIQQDALANTKRDDLATILYTSGTTGEPKGVMLSQWNIMSNVHGVLEMFEEYDSDTRVAFLPMSHIFARTCDIYTWLARGSQLALAEKRETIVADCRDFGPTLVNGVPYFFERVQNRLTESGKADEPNSLPELLGGHIRGCGCGGAALANHTYDFFLERGVPILQGYGLTETSPVISLSTLENIKRGTVGKPLVGIEVRIADDGEIITRGPNVMLGYWKDQQATDAILQDGWLSTGDLGQLDDEGYLMITGRKKEIIVTATGKNVAPALIESLLCRDPLIEQAMVIGDDRSYLSALIVPNEENLRREIKRQHLLVWSRRRAVTHPKVVAMYQECIERQLADLSHHEQVRKFLILDRGFTLEDGYITPKASLRRDAIALDFSREIERMYKK